MKSKLMILPIILITLSCCNEAKPEYKIEQTYDSEYSDGEMLYQVNTSIERITDDPDSPDDEIENVYSSIVSKVTSKDVDSIMLHEKSLAKMRVSEFKHLDDLTSAGEEN
jgi:hypothetical protein